MNLNTAKKILKIVGTLTIIGAVIAIIMGVISLIMGGAGTQLPEVEAGDKEVVTGVAALLVGGITAIISGLVSLFEGIASRSAAKNGKHATAAYIFACLGIISSIWSSLDLASKDGLNITTIISILVSIVLSVLTFMAAYTVRKAVKAEAE